MTWRGKLGGGGDGLGRSIDTVRLASHDLVPASPAYNSTY